MENESMTPLIPSRLTVFIRSLRVRVDWAFELRYVTLKKGHNVPHEVV